MGAGGTLPRLNAEDVLDHDYCRVNDDKNIAQRNKFANRLAAQAS
jgi:hypothetical protein